MNGVQILSCSNDLGNCCKNSILDNFLKSITNIINIIQIIVPILLLIMVIIELIKMINNPDDKKGLTRIKNKVLAAVIVFFIPVFLNIVINTVSLSTSKSFDFARCIKESNNIKVNANTNYSSLIDEKQKNIISDPSTYEKGKKKEKTNIIKGESISSNSCQVGDSSVNLVPNDSKRESAIIRKANGQDVADYAKSWVGKMSYEFTAQGELYEGGVCSCSHFVYQVLKHFGIIEDGFIRSTVWGSCAVKGTTLYNDASKLVPGDVVFASFGNAVGHVEIYIGNNTTVGCNSGKGVTIGTANGWTSYIHLDAYD